MTATTIPVPRTSPRPFLVAAASALAGLLLGVGGAALVIDDEAPAPASTVADTPRDDVGSDLAEVLRREQLRIAVQRCILAPNTPGAPERCEAGLRNP